MCSKAARSGRQQNWSASMSTGAPGPPSSASHSSTVLATHGASVPSPGTVSQELSSAMRYASDASNAHGSRAFKSARHAPCSRQPLPTYTVQTEPSSSSVQVALSQQVLESHSSPSSTTPLPHTAHSLSCTKFSSPHSVHVSESARISEIDAPLAAADS